MNAEGKSEGTEQLCPFSPRAGQAAGFTQTGQEWASRVREQRGLPPSHHNSSGAISLLCVTKAKPEKQEDRQGLTPRAPQGSPLIPATLHAHPRTLPAKETRFENEVLTTNHQGINLIFIDCWKMEGEGVNLFVS